MPRPPRPWIVFLVSWLLFAVIAGLWAIATPIAAAPDEPAHAIKAAATVRGDLLGEPGPEGRIVQVPQYIAYLHAQTCTAANDEVPASCIMPVPGDPGQLVQSATTAGLYNPLYYLIVGWPTLLGVGDGAIYAMRLLSALLTTLFLALTAMLLASWSGRVLPFIALGAATTPMVLFLAGTVNPNGPEITATLAAFTGVLSVVLRPDPARLAGRAAVVAVAGSVAANMRGLSPLWLAVALLVPFALIGWQRIRELWRERAIKTAVIVVAATTAFAVGWFLFTNNTAPAADLDPEETPYLGSSPLVGFFGMLARIGGNLSQMVGVFGWLDTAAPQEVYGFWALLGGSLVLWALALGRGRAFWFVASLGIAFVVLPALAQAAFITTGGWIWQGRYSLPLLVILFVGAAAVLTGAFGGLSLRTRRILLVTGTAGWAFAQVYTFGLVLHRYAIGAEGSVIQTLTDPLWQPPGGVLAISAAVTLATAALAVLATRMLWREDAVAAPSGEAAARP